VKLTPDTRSSAFNAKTPIPSLYESVLVLFHQGFYSTKLDGTKSKISGKRNWLEPELCGQFVSVDVNVSRLIGLVAIEIKPIGTGSQDGRHPLILLN
jgi:hypothetical protein